MSDVWCRIQQRLDADEVSVHEHRSDMREMLNIVSSMGGNVFGAQHAVCSASIRCRLQQARSTSSIGHRSLDESAERGTVNREAKLRATKPR